MVRTVGRSEPVACLTAYGLWITFEALVTKCLPSPGMTIRVDPVALRRLGEQLSGLATALNDTSSRCFADADPVLGPALLSVQHDWSRKRKEITEYLSSVGQAAVWAAESYSYVEDAIASAATVHR